MLVGADIEIVNGTVVLERGKRNVEQMREWDKSARGEAIQTVTRH
jgi:hypothetical protein